MKRICIVEDDKSISGELKELLLKQLRTRSDVPVIMLRSLIILQYCFSGLTLYSRDLAAGMAVTVQLYTVICRYFRRRA